MVLTPVPYHTKICHDGREYEVFIPNLVVPKCKECGTISLDEEANRQIDLAFRRKAKLLTPAEIRAKREELGLNQQQFADWFGVAVSTLSRWESGTQVQQRVMNDFLRAFFDVSAFRDYLKRIKSPPRAAEGPPQAATMEPAPASNKTIETFSVVLRPRSRPAAVLV
jgi:putative zinc finger/helix-turn-helix YgiT family protein